MMFFSKKSRNQGMLYERITNTKKPQKYLFLAKNQEKRGFWDLVKNQEKRGLSSTNTVIRAYNISSLSIYLSKKVLYIQYNIQYGHFSLIHLKDNSKSYTGVKQKWRK